SAEVTQRPPRRNASKRMPRTPRWIHRHRVETWVGRPARQGGTRLAASVIERTVSVCRSIMLSLAWGTVVLLGHARHRTRGAAPALRAITGASRTFRRQDEVVAAADTRLPPDDLAEGTRQVLLQLLVEPPVRTGNETFPVVRGQALDSSISQVLEE